MIATQFVLYGLRIHTPLCPDAYNYKILCLTLSAVLSNSLHSSSLLQKVDDFAIFCQYRLLFSFRHPLEIFCFLGLVIDFANFCQYRLLFSSRHSLETFCFLGLVIDFAIFCQYRLLFLCPAFSAALFTPQNSPHKNRR